MMKRFFYFLIMLAIVFSVSGCKGGGGGSGSSASAKGLPASTPTNLVINSDAGDTLLIEQALNEDINTLVLSVDIDDGQPQEDQDPGYSGDQDLDPDGPQIPDDVNINPEPSTLLLFATSLLGLFGYKFRRLRK